MITKSCSTCGKEFSRKYPSEFRPSKSGGFFCSRRCSGIINCKSIPRNPAKTRVCYRCDKPFKAENGHKSKKACPDCYKLKEYMSLLTIKDIEDSERKQARDKYGRIRLHCRSIHKNLTVLPCAECGYKNHVELCHIKAIKDWPKDTTLAEVNSSKNVIQLCPNHHWELDAGILKLGTP